jgi:hypothetical protein
MAPPLLEEVFKLSGIPTFTFVEPLEYPKLLVALRTPGRGVVIEGPSGIGKTTAVSRALSELGMDDKVVGLSARKAEDREMIAELPSMTEIGTVIIDDFHRLDEDVRREVADYLKTAADEEATDSKLIVVGINRAGESLIRFAKDLVNRIDTIRFEVNPDDRVGMLIQQGEKALNIKLGITDEIVCGSNGSFYIAQMLAQETCIAAEILEAADHTVDANVSYEVVLSRVIERLSGSFLPIATKFASGTKLRREGRAPYLHILRWLAEANEWSIDLEREAARHPTMKGSVSQVVDKGYLQNLLTDPELADALHFDPDTKVLGAEDPQFVFFIRNIAWLKFAERVGYLNVDFESKYDFALSFAGANRDLASRIADRLNDGEVSVFYDKDEEARILAENVEDYLGPIYRSEATFVVPLLSSAFPERIWTKFESNQFKDRFGDHSVIPVWYSDIPPSAFGPDRGVGGITFDVTGDLEAEATRIAGLLIAKLRDRKIGAVAALADEEPEPLFRTPQMARQAARWRGRGRCCP